SMYTGYLVIAPVRGEVSKLHDSMREGEKYVGHCQLRTPQMDYGTAEGAQALATYVQEVSGHIDHVFVVGGGMGASKVASEISARDWQETSQHKVIPQLLTAQHLIPLLRDEETSSYTVVTGASGELCYLASFALRCMANAAVYGLVLALQAEHRQKRFRINELRIAALICHDDEEQHPVFKMAAAPSSRLAVVYIDRVVRTGLRDSVVRITPEDL
ncbi:SDR family NAD(P)-dependent oxidoreductase, partial [archaeon]